MTHSAAAGIAERSARTSYGKLLAILTARTKDIAAAEDALADAFHAALRTWPEQGVPANPDAWLLTVARRQFLNHVRHQTVVAGSEMDLTLLHDTQSPDVSPMPDDRLKLLFVCAHPAIDPAVRTPLMLQTVLGLDAHHIAKAFLVPASTMGQRLVRAKAKIKAAGLRFAVPDKEEMPDRLDDVLNAIYAAYGASWDHVAGAEFGPADLVNEALFLARLLITLLPNEPEARGLLALMLYCEARRPARRAADGRFIPLKQQNADLWIKDNIIEAERELAHASSFGIFGRFQCEAAIQSVHIQTPITGQTHYAALEALYSLLATRYPSIGVRVAQAALMLERGDAPRALSILQSLSPDDVQTYQPYWVTCAHAFALLGDSRLMHDALEKALALTGDPALKTFLCSEFENR